MKKTWIGMMIVALACTLAACQGTTIGQAPDTQDGDVSGDNDSADHDSQVTPDGDKDSAECTPGATRCSDDTHVQTCSETGAWGEPAHCDAGEVCADNACASAADGDSDTEEGTHCLSDEDCPFLYGCIADAADNNGCIKKTECLKDADCGHLKVCVQAGNNWLVCQDGPNECDSDSDCTVYGFGCKQGTDTYYHCVDINECTLDTDCSTQNAGYACMHGPTHLVCQPDGQKCSANTDCTYGYKCYTNLAVPVCLYESDCSVDNDCPALQRCQNQENWKECAIDTSFKICKADSDCAAGYYCAVVAAGYGTCKSQSSCAMNSDCPSGQECVATDSVYNCQDIPACTANGDCTFGYKCVSGTCTYADQCASDAACTSALQSCQANGEGNGHWTTCQTSMPTFCTSDDNCDATQYCDTLVAVAGECRSRSQCFIDADCGENMRCVANSSGTTSINECVSANPQSCLIDAQCANDWICINRECQAAYEGMCAEVEGLWTVAVSDCTGVTTGQSYEFVPKEGCTGDVRLNNTEFPIGSFSENDDGSYAVTLAYILKCQAQVTMNVLMAVTCDLGSSNTCTVNMIPTSK